MRPVSVFAKGPGSEIERVRAELQGRWRQAAGGTGGDGAVGARVTSCADRGVARLPPRHGCAVSVTADQDSVRAAEVP